MELKLGTKRTFNIYRSFNLSPIPKDVVTTNMAFEEEIYANLEYISEINEVSNSFFIKKGYIEKRTRKKIQLLFKSFVRQSKTFYKAAKISEFRASPLLYYYCFLNLVKAYLTISNPKLFDTKISHGLYHPFKSDNFKNQFVVSNVGVFSEFYKKLTNTAIKKNTNLNIAKLFGYIFDISYEFNLLNYGDVKYIFGDSQILLNNQTKECWPIIYLTNSQIYNYKRYFCNFLNLFERCPLDGGAAKEIFNIRGENLDKYIFFQSKKIYINNSNINEVIQEIYKDIWPNLEKFCFHNDIGFYGFYFYLPLLKNNQIHFNNVLAAYVIMFYLGSLIRYNPHYLEKLISSKHSWIIERFIKGASLVFLRNIVNLIMGEAIIYSTH